MASLRTAFRLVSALSVAAGGVAAAQDEARLQVAAGTWSVDYGESRCTLTRRIGGEQAPVLVLSSSFDLQRSEILLLRDGTEPLPGLPRRIGIVLSPGDRREEARAVAYQAQVGPGYRIEGVAEGFADRLAASRSLGIVAGERTLLTIPVPGARQAVAALGACTDNLMTSWGVDLAARSRFSRQARLVEGDLDDFDYPAAAISGRAQGVVVIRLTVSPQGRVSDCRVVASSRVPVLDARACEVTTRRFRYEPALDADGNPVASPFIMTINWQLRR